MIRHRILLTDGRESAVTMKRSRPFYGRAARLLYGAPAETALLLGEAGQIDQNGRDAA